MTKDSYNERLFESGGLRSFLHNARFHWFKEFCQDHTRQPADLVELGCFDGRLISFCPEPPRTYQGFDADWEGGLTAAKERFKDHPNWKFSKATDPAELAHVANKSVQVAVAMETLEHIPDSIVDGYLAEFARITDGYLIVSVPNEKGITFLAKHLIKSVILRSVQRYSWSEILNATLGRMHRVERDEHKGFDYHALIKMIERHFTIVKVQSVPFPWLPLWAGFTIGIVAKSKPDQG